MSSKGKPVFMISADGKTESQLADEVWEAVQKHLYATGQPHEHLFDYSTNPAGTCTVCGYND